MVIKKKEKFIIIGSNGNGSDFFSAKTKKDARRIILKNLAVGRKVNVTKFVGKKEMKFTPKQIGGINRVKIESMKQKIIRGRIVKRR